MGLLKKYIIIIIPLSISLFLKSNEGELIKIISVEKFIELGPIIPFSPFFLFFFSFGNE